MVAEYASQYQEIWASVGDPKSISTIIEIGINDGDGVKKLKSQYPHANIFAFDVHNRAYDYNKPYDDIMRELEGLATVIIQRSPLPYEWKFPYDLCTIDIGSNYQINFEVLSYWIKYKNPGGKLVILIPMGDATKREKREKFIKLLEATDFQYETVKPNWFIFK